MRFIGRKKELKLLEEEQRKDTSSLIIIYGRRRTGKTRLIKESLKGRDSLYFLLTQESLLKNMESFQSALSFSLFEPLVEEIQASSWEEYFRKVVKMIPEGYTIAIDEFPYMISQDKSIVSQFQKIYDEYLKPRKINLILCGSALSIMGDIIAYKSPLYGRATARIRLKGFSFHETKEYLKGISDLKDIARYHMLSGGIPYYLEQFSASESFENNIRHQFLSGQGVLLDEVSFLLRGEFRETRNYLSILRAIGRGKTTFTEISMDTLIDKASLSRYLSSLEDLCIIKTIHSFFDKINSKKTRYSIDDPFIFIWFSVFYKNISMLENSEIQRRIIKEYLPTAFGYLFEKLCIDILSKHFEKIGPYFKGETEIDIIGKKDSTMFCYECKFSDSINESKIRKELEDKLNALKSVGAFEFIPQLISITKGDITLKDLLSLSKGDHPTL